MPCYINLPVLFTDWLTYSIHSLITARQPVLLHPINKNKRVINFLHPNRYESHTARRAPVKSSSSSDRVEGEGPLFHHPDTSTTVSLGRLYSAQLLNGVPSPSCCVHEWCGRSVCRRWPWLSEDPVLTTTACDKHDGVGCGWLHDLQRKRDKAKNTLALVYTYETHRAARFAQYVANAATVTQAFIERRNDTHDQRVTVSLLPGFVFSFHCYRTLQDNYESTMA